MFSFDPGFLTSLVQVILIDLVLAGDNAVVIALASRDTPPDFALRKHSRPTMSQLSLWKKSSALVW